MVLLPNLLMQSFTEVRIIRDSYEGVFFLVSFQNYDPTLEDMYRKRFPVDERLCLVELIDTAGQREPAFTPLPQVADLYHR
jgi:hypothetical protein